MRKIEVKMLEAFRSGKSFNGGNTVVTKGGEIYLHGNLIAWKRRGAIFISNRGWETPTTKSRLNALGAGIYQKNFNWFWKDGKKFPYNQLVNIKTGKLFSI